MAIVTLAAFGLLLTGAAVLVAGVVTAGRPGGVVRIAGALEGEASRMLSRAHARVAVSALAVLSAGVASSGAILALDVPGIWVAGFLVAAGAGCIVVAAMGPTHGSVAAAVRSAELRPRLARSFGPRWAFTIPTLLAGVFAAVLVGTASTASQVDGTSALVWDDGSNSGWIAYPGWSTVLPMLALLVIAAGTFARALRRVAQWPRPTQPGLFALDDDIRRATTRMVLVGTSGALFGALGAFCSDVAGAWAVALLNERVNQAADGSYPADRSPAESVWGFLQGGGMVCVAVGFALMTGAVVAGRVRRPLLEDRVRPAGGAQVVG